MPAKINLENISIVLLGTRFPENIGAAARAICNMGIGQLVVVAPYNCDLTKICRMATHAASDVVEQMRVYEIWAKSFFPYPIEIGLPFCSDLKTADLPTAISVFAICWSIFPRPNSLRSIWPRRS